MTRAGFIPASAHEPIPAKDQLDCPESDEGESAISPDPGWFAGFGKQYADEESDDHRREEEDDHDAELSTPRPRTCFLEGESE